MNAELIDERKPVNVKKFYTYEDFEKIPEEVHLELYDGVPYPTYGSEPCYDFTDPIYLEGPGRQHQEILIELIRQFGNFFRRKPCKVLAAPFDVRFKPEREKCNIIVPDLLVVCDKKQLNGKYCLNAPDFVIEIISPSTRRKDTGKKLHRFMEERVREIWLIIPDETVVQTYILEDEKYKIMSYIYPREIRASIFDGLTVDFTDIFPPGMEDEEEN
jgi:Uma2 family endonuclease